jgi:hypothetical protein
MTCAHGRRRHRLGGFNVAELPPREPERQVAAEEIHDTVEAVAEMWEDVGVHPVVEGIDPAMRHQKSRQQIFKGLWWSDPTSIFRDPDGMMGPPSVSG